MHKGVLLVRNLMDKCGPRIQELAERPEINDRDVSIRTSYLRAHAWILSLSKLNHPSDLQAVACGCRSLLECAVDIVLLANDSTNRSGERMRWWDLSAKLQMAVAFVEYEQKGTGQEWARDFIQRNETFVKELRTNLWPQWKERNGKPRHPPRWTGSNDIRADIVEADRSTFQGTIRQNLNQTLLSYYSSEYQRLNKTIHGSGLVGIQGSPQLISIRAAHGCWAAASLAMICHQVLCSDRGLDRELLQDWAHILKVRMTGFIYHVREIENQDLN